MSKTVTNRFNLPEPIYKAICHYNEKYSRGDAVISATELIKPPRMVTLTEKHFDEIETDASDELFKIDGLIVHHILENHAAEGDETEMRHFATFCGWKISGQIDRFVPVDGLLQDWKRVTVASRSYGKDEWEPQLNIYAQLARQNGREVKKLEAVRWYRDFYKSKSAQHDYPDIAIETVPIPLWPEEKAKKYIIERVLTHQKARLVLPECTDEERWKEPDFAVMKKGRETAIKLLNNYNAAVDLAQSLQNVKGVTHYVVDRGRSRRCEYCQVDRFCTQRATMLAVQKEREMEVANG